MNLFIAPLKIRTFREQLQGLCRPEDRTIIMSDWIWFKV